MRFVLATLLVAIMTSASAHGCLAASPGVQNPGTLQHLTPTQWQSLEENGFVVVPDSVPQIYSIYQSAVDRGDPVFVTTDAVLHAFHVLYDYALRQAEWEHFVPALGDLLGAMLQGSLQLTASPSDDVRAAAWDNVAFFSVAQQLLNPGLPIPPGVHDEVESELELIMGQAGIAESPIFGREEDYSQYVPRGHYTRNETFERYFRSMMWLGRMPFLLKPGDAPAAVELGRHQTRQALLATFVLRGGSAADRAPMRAWERIYQPTSFFVGTSDDLDASDYAQLMDEIYGAGIEPSEFADTNRLDGFIAAALTLRPPRIVSSLVTDYQDAPLVTKGFRFMGQRFVFDSYIFQQLVYDRVGAYLGTGEPFTSVESPVGLIRGFPRALDVATAFGSERALEIMRSEGDTEYEGYEEQVGTLRQELSHLVPEQWTQNLYWSWLNSLRPLLDETEATYPAFMRGSTWADKDLQTFLGSWTELRHDTVLYAKQSMTIQATSLRPERSASGGYVEPRPEVYDRLAALSRNMRDGLRSANVLNTEIDNKLGRLAELLESLSAISVKELSGDPPSAEDASLIGGFGRALERLTTFSSTMEGNLSAEADERMAIVVEVHTDPNSAQVLEEAVGDAFRVYVLVPKGAETVAMVGGVFSYYEFKRPMGDRLTDESWQTMGQRPAQPTWVQSFVTE